jgi:hypothetical protein
MDKEEIEIVEDTVKKNDAEPMEVLKSLIGKTDLILTKEGDLYKTDFDNLEEEGVLRDGTSHPPTKNILKKLSMKLRKKHTSEDLTEDLTNKQVEENYYHETKMSKLDGSTAMMETRISKCQEANPEKSLEECAKEVKTRMIKAGSENTNTEDLEEVIEEEEITEDTEDAQKTEICPKELDMLREKAKKFDEMKEDFETSKEDMASKVKDLIEYVDGIKAKEAEKEKQKLEKRTKKFSEDFLISEEKAKEDLKKLKEAKNDLDLIEIVRDFIEGAGVKAQSKEEEEAVGYDVEKFKTDFEKLNEELLEKWRHD